MSAVRKKRPDPRKQFPRVHKRLEDWAHWVVSDRLDGLGWNVYYSDADIRVVVQQRNDTHSDPTFLEVMHLSPSDKRIWSTHTAITELPVLWRNILFCLYVDMPQAANWAVAQRLGVDHRMVGDHLWWAFFEVDRKVLTFRNANGTVGYCADNTAQANT